MAGQKLPPLPSSRRKAVQGAVFLALSVLQDERVREQLRKAPVAAREWAEHRRAIDATSRTREPGGFVNTAATDSPGVAPAAKGSLLPPSIQRLDPTQRFGQKGIERRLAALRRNADLVFTDPTDRNGGVIFQAIDELGQAAEISATMTMNQRRKARARIATELTRLERALVDAVLPPEPTSP